MNPLRIDGAWAFTPQVHRDDRGNFFEAFRGAEFAADLGYQLEVAQVNCSVSRRGVIRGIHYADVPPGQAKYVTCVAGAIMDVVVDLREGSPGFGTWEATRLDDTSRRALFSTEGLGHAFMALSEQATVLYLCSTRTHRAASTLCTLSTLILASPGRSTISAATSCCRPRTPPLQVWRRRFATARSRSTTTAPATLPGCGPRYYRFRMKVGVSS